MALAIQSGALAAMLLFLDESYAPYYYIIAMACYSLLISIFNSISIRKNLKYRQEMGNTFLKPFLSAAVMGVVAFGVYHGLYALLPVNILALFVSVVVAVIVYFVLVIRMGAMTEDELSGMPKGKMLVRIAKKLHLMKETRDGYDGFNEMDDSDNFDRKKVPDIEDADYWLDD